LHWKCQESICGDGYTDSHTTVNEECDDGNDVSGDGCEPETCQYSCHEDHECDDELPCSINSCSGTSHACTTSFLDSTVVCRHARGVCDRTEYCDGLSAACPEDELAPTGSICQDTPECSSPGVCDENGSCVGTEISFFQHVAQVAAGSRFTCVLTDFGAVKCWGINDKGQLGNGTNDDSRVPVAVDGLDSGVAALAVGGAHACAIVSAGEVKCWGSNPSGQLGNGTTNSSNVPVAVANLSSPAVTISAFGSKTCAVTDDNTVYCWGSRFPGTNFDTSPVPVSGMPDSVAALALGGHHACVLTVGGELYCWGENQYGQLGNGTTEDSYQPVVVSTLGSNVAAVATGWDHTCALLKDGAVSCWGNNDLGQIGDGSHTPQFVPVAVELLGSARQIAASDSTCAVLVSGDLYCWGQGMFGVLGNGSNLPRYSPTKVLHIDDRRIEAVDVAYWHACAIYAENKLLCWGDNYKGQLGNPCVGSSAVPREMQGTPAGGVALALGSAHGCLRTVDRDVYCWGANSSGQLGNGENVPGWLPESVASLSGEIIQVAVGASFSCVLTVAGEVWCWGNNYYGQLGNGTDQDSNEPVSPVALPSAATTIAAGHVHACASLASGGVMCWGHNEDGQLGNGTLLDSFVPVAVDGLNEVVQSVAAGGYHSCALLTDGSLKCWGRDHHNQLGSTQPIGYSPVPVVADMLNIAVTEVAGGEEHTCALTVEGGVVCWGDNFFGQLGTGDHYYIEGIVEVNGLSSGVTTLAAGQNHTCALGSNGAVHCWGCNETGALGMGSYADSVHGPVEVEGLPTPIVRVATGREFSCALAESGAIFCWGSNSHGQLDSVYCGYPRPVLCRLE